MLLLDDWLSALTYGRRRGQALFFCLQPLCQFHPDLCPLQQGNTRVLLDGSPCAYQALLCEAATLLRLTHDPLSHVYTTLRPVFDKAQTLAVKISSADQCPSN